MAPEIELNFRLDCGCNFWDWLNRKLEMLHQDVIHAINQSESKVLSIDIPSAVWKYRKKFCAVRADLTTTYVGKKSGFTDSGPDCAEKYSFRFRHR